MSSMNSNNNSRQVFETAQKKVNQKETYQRE